MCYQDGLTPKFLNFKLANSSLKHSRTYKQCQLMLLKENIKTKSIIIIIIIIIMFFENVYATHTKFHPGTSGM